MPAAIEEIKKIEIVDISNETSAEQVSMLENLFYIDKEAEQAVP